MTARKKQFKLQFDTANDAFREDYPGEHNGSLRHETVRILRDLADEIEDFASSGVVFDINGARVGAWGLS